MLRENEIINGTYQILQEIGSGGMGVIYLAYHINLQKYVVIKKIKDNFVGSIDARAEADIMKNLRHSYIPQIYDFLQFDSEIYTVMNYIEGYDFKQYLESGYDFTEKELVKWLGQCLEVLDYLHSQNPPIIHSDIKPANIMLDNNDNICLIDFNISFEQDNENRVIGATAAYAPIEQIFEQTVFDYYEGYKNMIITDARTDIYSLGATFYHMATHIRPNIDINDTYPIIDLDIPYSEAFKKIIYKAMQKNPEDRYNSAKEMLHEINNMRKHTTEYKLKRLAIIASACVIGVTAGLCGVYGYKGAKEKKLNKFEKEYNNTISISADNSPDEVIDKAIDMLNNEQYSDYFDKYVDKEGNLLYQIALSYYSKKEYDSANEYFEDALLCIDESDIYRDYAVSLAKSGNLAKAQMIVDDNSEKIDEMDIRQIRAEINFEESNYSEAIDDFIYVLNNSSDEDLRIRTTVLLCEAYYEMGNYEAMEELLLTDTMSEDYIASKNRLLSIAYIGMANKYEGVERSRYYGMAEECLKYLEEINCLNYEEELNLVILYQNTGKFNMASDKLSDMMSKYPEDYRIYVQKCFLIYNEQASYAADKRNYSEFESCYLRTISLYNSQNTSGIDNEKIIQLKNLYQELKDMGYL